MLSVRPVSYPPNPAAQLFTPGSITTGSGLTTLTANVSTTGAQNYNGALTLANTVALAAGGSAITVQGPVNGAFALSRTDAGQTTFNDTVGATSALSTITTPTSSTTTFNNTVRTSSTQTYNGALVMNGASLTTTNSTITVVGATTLGADVNVSTGTAAASFAAVNGAFSLTRTGSTGSTTFGAVGGTTPLTSLSTTTASNRITTARVFCARIDLLRSVVACWSCSRACDA